MISAAAALGPVEPKWNWPDSRKLPVGFASAFWDFFLSGMSFCQAPGGVNHEWRSLWCESCHVTGVMGNAANQRGSEALFLLSVQSIT